MAVRITTSAHGYTRAIGLGTLTAWSAACWIKISVDTNAQATFWVIDTGGVFGDRFAVRCESNGTTARGTSDHGGHGNRELTVGTWYYFSVALHPDGGRQVTCAAGDPGFTTNTFTVFGQSLNAANLRFGKDAANGDVLNGCVANFKLWTATLSQEELEAEAFQYLPSRTADLRIWYPFLTASGTDFSGAGHTLSGGTGATTEDGPPIRWSSGRRRIFVPNSSGALGEIAAALPALTATASGTATVTGQQAALLPPLTAALDAAATVAGQPALLLPALTADVAGEAGAPGLLVAHLPALTGAFDGTLTGGFLTAQLPALTGSVQGELTVHGTASAVLPPLGASLAGEAEIPHNNLDVSVGPPYRGWTSRPLAPAWTAGVPHRGWTARQPTT